MSSTGRPVLVGLIVKVTAVVTSVLILTIVTVQRSEAAFVATTSNASNSFDIGSVVLTDDDSGTAAFTATNMSPGSPVVECLTVTYSGTVLPAPVRLYGTTTGTADTYLDTTIEVGTGGVFGDCTGFSSSSTIYSGTLADFSTNNTDFASGLAVFTAAVNPTSQTLRFTIDVQDNNSAQGLTSTANFTFEAQA